MNWQDRQVDYEKKCIELLQQISPSENAYQASQKYETLIKNLNKRLPSSGHSVPKNNILFPILEEIVRLDNSNPNL